MTTATKTFIAADNTAATADTSLSYVGDGGEALKVLSNKLAPANDNGGAQMVYLNGQAFGLRQRVEVTVGGADGGSYITALLRCDGTWSNALFWIVSSGYGVLRKRVGGTQTDIGDAFPSLTAGDVLAVEVNAAGDTVSVQKNGTHIGGSPYTVSVLPTGTRVGAGFYSADTTEAARITQFTADDFAASGVTATLTATDGSDTLAGTASIAIAASAALTAAGDVLASTAASVVSVAFAKADATDVVAGAAATLIAASAALADGADTVTGQGTVAVAASVSANDGNDTVTATLAGQSVTATLSVTDAADGLASSAVLTITASAGIADATDAISITAAVSVAAQLALADAADSLSAIGSVAASAALALLDQADSLVSRIGSGEVHLVATIQIPVTARAVDVRVQPRGIAIPDTRRKLEIA